MATDFQEEKYNQRWQVETVMYMLKQHQGASLTAHRYQTRRREMGLMAITHNIMIVLLYKGFYRAFQEPFYHSECVCDCSLRAGEGVERAEAIPCSDQMRARAGFECAALTSSECDCPDRSVSSTIYVRTDVSPTCAGKECESLYRADCTLNRYRSANRRDRARL